VRANKATDLDVNWQVESALHFDDSWAGFLFATEVERGRETFYANDLVRHIGGADVIVLRTMSIDNIPYVVGMQYPANGAAPIGALVPLKGSDGLLRSLARFLYDGTMAAGLRVLPGADKGVSQAVSLANEADRPRRSLLPPTTIAVGALAIAFGSVEYLRHPYDPKNGEVDDGRDPFVGAMLGGSVVLGGGIYWWLREVQPASHLTAALLGAGLAGTASGVELYLTNQEPAAEGPRYIRDSAALGIGVGVAGLTLTGVGLWFLHRDRADEQSHVRGPSSARRRHSLSASFLASRSFTGIAGTF
jgi:hypothetical protein